MSQVINQALLSFALVIVIAMLTALLIKGIVKAFSIQKPKAPPPIPAKVIPAVPSGLPQHHLIAIAAAVHMLHRRVRIVRIRGNALDSSWTSVGRSLQQSSHQVRR